MGINLLDKLGNLAKPKFKPVLDEDFSPASLANYEFLKAVKESSQGNPLIISIERADGSISRFETSVFAENHPMAELNLPYIERIVKFLLWQKGGWKVTIGGSDKVGEYIKNVYSSSGKRYYDYEYHGQTISEHTFEVYITNIENVPVERETSMPFGRNLKGNRIGFDLGASDRKAAAVIDGEVVYTEEVVWNPQGNANPAYHYAEINSALISAARHLPRVDAIGGSSAGIIINNRAMIASLFRGIPKDQYYKIKNVFIDLAKEWGVPFEVANDGDVTALAGAMSLNDNCVLGVAMGSSEAAGYVNAEGNITGWLNELAFSPIDYREDAPVDEWSGDTGCGSQYLTQQAVFRLAELNGISLDKYEMLADKLKAVQKMLEDGNEIARKIWESIGVYMGYAIAHYAMFYDIKHMIILGRVTSGIGGDIILKIANEVLTSEFPEIAEKIVLCMPDEVMKRVGQACAAASLPITN